MRKQKFPAIKLHEISKQYRNFSIIPPKIDRNNALYECSFELEKGKITCLLGPNGAGKTTIMKIIAGLVLPDTGTVSFAPGEKERIGFVTPNERSFYWRLSGRENLKFFASLYHLHGKEKEKQIARIIEATGLSEFVDTPYRLYSSGMKQRLNIARALLPDPTIILLDEPTSHLDPLAKVALWDFLKSYFIEKNNSTICLATHDLEEASILTDKTIILNEGRVVASGAIEDLQRELEDGTTYVFKLKRSDLNERVNNIITDFKCEYTDSGYVVFSIDDILRTKLVVADLANEGVIPVVLNMEKPSLLSIIKHYTGHLS